MREPKQMFEASIARRHLLLPLLAMIVPDGATAHTPYSLKKTVELIVPFPAGGSMDAVGRLVAVALTEELDSEVVVANVGGASGAAGVRRLQDRPANGRTLLLASITQLMLVPQPLAPIGPVSSTDFVIVAGNDFKAATLDEFVALARAGPGRVSLAHPGLDTLQYLSACTVERRARIKLLLVPYSGSAPMLSDLAAGRVDTALIAVPGAVSLVRSGRLKVLGLLRDRPQPSLLNWPYSGASRSLRDLNTEAWAGLFAANGTPAVCIDSLRHALTEALRSTSLAVAISRLGSSAADPNQVADGPGFARFVEAEVVRYAAIQRAALGRQ